MLKLWGRVSSINVRKVVFTAQLLDLPFERVDAGAAFGVVRTPAEKRSQAAIDASIAATEPLLEMLDARLARQRFRAAPSMFP
jgi:glutathione S-transferase